jgi:hypothetical protein
VAEEAQPVKNLSLHLPENERGGVWSNFAVVAHSQYEFTIDFARVDFANQGNDLSGIVVSRVNLSPLMVTELMDALRENWDSYATKAMPKEVRDDGATGQ